MIRLLAYITMALALVACNKGNAPEAQAMPQVKALPPLVFVGVDGSGSYNYLENAKDRFTGLIELLPPAAYINVRWISADSYGPANSIVTSDLPDIYTSDTINPFDRREAMRHAISQKKLSLARTEVSSAVLGATFPNARRTDILGLLVYVAERNATMKGEGKPLYVMLFTDLLNNVTTYSKYLNEQSLSGASVYVMSYESSSPETRSLWMNNLMGWGARDVQFYGPDERIPDIFERND